MKKCIQVVLYFMFVIHFSSCERKAFPEEKFLFSKSFLEIFQGIKSNDTLLFENSKNKIDTFVLTGIDSTINNSNGYFINTRASKEKSISYKQIPINYWAESRIEKAGTNSEEKITEDAKLITITKYPDNNINEIYLSFKNFRCLVRDSIGINKDTLKIGKIYFTDYYKMTTDANSLLRDSSDIEIIYITIKNGIIAYQDKSGKWGMRKNL